ncbi:MAG TPA: hypothetical protein PKY13_03115 [Microthrixaceae bacterium]|jgi:hypothetical protein|nr:hypothetical protein [Microthrixaceae bacterium]HQF93686.1 hypothetical protein [Microthrixaceae bacterium]
MSTRRTAALATVLVLVNVLAYWATVHSLRGDGFDGLNNSFQLLLGLPWTLTPRGADHVFNALVDLGCGLINGAILVGWIYVRGRKVSGGHPGS